MKYIVFKAKFGDIEKEYPIIFPNDLVHAEVYEAIACRMKPFSLMKTEPVSAGELSSLDILDSDISFTSGKSETLNIESRRYRDKVLIHNYDYEHGLL